MDFPRLASHAPFTTVRPNAMSGKTVVHNNIWCLPLIQIFVVLTTSRNTTKSGGGWLASTEDGWMKTSSSIPRARYGTPREVEYCCPEAASFATRSFRTATWSMRAAARSCRRTFSCMIVSAAKSRGGYQAYLKGAWRQKVRHKARTQIREINLDNAADLSPQLVYFFHCLKLGQLLRREE